MYARMRAISLLMCENCVTNSFDVLTDPPTRIHIRTYIFIRTHSHARLGCGSADQPELSGARGAVGEEASALIEQLQVQIVNHVFSVS